MQDDIKKLGANLKTKIAENMSQTDEILAFDKKIKDMARLNDELESKI